MKIIEKYIPGKKVSNSQTNVNGKIINIDIARTSYMDGFILNVDFYQKTSDGKKDYSLLNPDGDLREKLNNLYTILSAVYDETIIFIIEKHNIIYNSGVKQMKFYGIQFKPYETQKDVERAYSGQSDATGKGAQRTIAYERFISTIYDKNDFNIKNENGYIIILFNDKYNLVIGSNDFYKNLLLVPYAKDIIQNYSLNVNYDKVVRVTESIKYFLKESIRKKILESDVTNKIWYHGSNKSIKKFRFDLIGKNSERITNYHGYGIYFINNIDRAKKYGDIIIKVKIADDSDIMEGAMIKEQLLKIFNQMKKEKFELRPNDENYYNNPPFDDKHSVINDVVEFYDYLLRAYRNNLKSIKDVSEFLLRSGIDGMKVVNDVGDEILVMFNEDKIKIF